MSRWLRYSPVPTMNTLRWLWKKIKHLFLNALRLWLKEIEQFFLFPCVPEPSATSGNVDGRSELTRYPLVGTLPK